MENLNATVPDVWPNGKKVTPTRRQSAELMKTAYLFADTVSEVETNFKTMLRVVRPDYAEGTIDTRYSLNRQYFNNYMGVSI